MENCYICGATPKKLAQRRGRNNKFTADKKALSFGFSNLHVKIRAFEWVCKGAMHRGCKSYACRGEVNQAERQSFKDDLRVDFKREFGRNIYLPNGQSNNGNAARITHMPESLILGIKTAIDAVDSPFKGKLISESYF
jgi:hypothetical protein